MARNFISKFREGLYKVSAIEDLQNDEDTSAILEFLQVAKRLRNSEEDNIIEVFRRAFFSNKSLSMKALFYVRDKENGLGERRIFRVLIKYLALTYPDDIRKNLHLIPKYGRWDDFYALFYTPLEDNVISIFKRQILLDSNCKSPTTLGKWLKSENTSSKESRKLAKRTRQLLGYSSKEYRMILSSLRRKIGIIENILSRKKYEDIKYFNFSLETIIRYKKAFIRNDRNEFKKYLKSIEKIKKTKNINFNEKTLNQTPVDIISDFLENTNSNNNDIYSNLWNMVCDNYTPYIKDTFIIIAVSGIGCNNYKKAFEIAISNILMYHKFNTNRFKDYYMYFDKNPKFGKIRCNSFQKQIKNIHYTNSFVKCNISAALDMLLFTALKEGLNHKELPQNILVISDDPTCKDYLDNKIQENIKEKWKLAKFLIPKIKIWIIDDSNKEKNIKNINENVLITGYSKELFKLSIKGEEVSEEMLLIKTLEDMYEDVIL